MKKSSFFIIAFFVLILPYIHACEIQFQYDATSSSASTVYITGTFNNWATDPPDVWEMEDDNGDQIWTLTTNIPIGTYLYKLIVDGTYMQDPSNPDSEPDGFGGIHSILTVICDIPRFEVSSYYLSQSAGAFTATLNFIPGESGAELDSDSLVATLNHDLLPSAAVVVQGSHIQVNVPGLNDGIHDIRLMGNDMNGTAIQMALMKAYVGYSSDWRDIILYFAMIDRFHNGDPSNDTIDPSLPELTRYHGGDLQGLLDKINSGYFDELGINAIWITWPGDNPEDPEWGSYVDSDDCNIPQGAPGYPRVDKQFSAYHGYWPSNLREVEEHFGDMELMRMVVTEAHSRGIRILLDLPVNHVHISSSFFTDKPNSFFNIDPIEVCEEIAWEHPETCWFTDFLPDIHYQDLRAVRDIINMAAWWVEETGCDGFRVDALKHVALNFIAALRFEMTQRFARTGADFYLLGETFSGNPYDLTPFLGDDLVHGEFDFPLNLSILETFGTQEKNMMELYADTRSHKEIYKTTSENALMSNFIGNHDIARFLSLAAGDLTCGVWDNISHISQGWRHPPGTPSDSIPYAKMRLAFSYIFTLPDVPLVYYGDEFGLPGANDPDNRRPMLFNNELNTNQQQNLNYMKELSAIRHAHPALRHAAMGPPLYADDDFLAYPRISDSEIIAVALNRSGSQRAVDIGVSSLGLRNGDTMQDALSGETIAVQNNQITVSLDAYSAGIYVAETIIPTPSPTPRPSATPDMSPTPGNTPTPSPIPTATPEPTELTIRIFLNNSVVTAGDFCRLTREIENHGEDINTAVFTLMDVYGSYFFWPSWSENFDYRTQNLNADETIRDDLFEFNWPEHAGSGSVTFWAALLKPSTWELMANIDTADLTWQ